MCPVEKNFDWRIGYGVFCLIYAGTLIYLGLGNFNKVYGEYRQVKYQLQPVQIQKIAFNELAAECRTKLKRRSPRNEKITPAINEGNCLIFPANILEKRQKDVTKRLQVEKKRFQRKLIVFYLSFGLFFVFLPLWIFYLFLKILIWLFKDIKISK